MADLRVDQYGSFGLFAQNYSKSRQSCPASVIRTIFNNVQKPTPILLDLGCGTGISTRALARFGAVLIGLDSDPKMIEAAQQTKGLNVSYSIGAAEQIPYSDSLFDGVTAFSSFHWFNERNACDEITRVLRPDGRLFVINKTDTSGLNTEIRYELAKTLGAKLPDVKFKYDPEHALRENGFSNIRHEAVDAVEVFSPSGALEYVQSMGVWPAIPEHLRADALRSAEEIIRCRLRKGKLHKTIRINIFVARPNSS